MPRFNVAFNACMDILQRCIVLPQMLRRLIKEILSIVAKLMRSVLSVDNMQVRDWGSGKPEELQSLQVESFRAGKAGSNKPQSFYTHLTYAVAQATVSATNSTDQYP